MKKYALLILALLLGTVLRLYQLGSIPNALTWDEAALGYNAFSILKTGKDEFGTVMPLIFKSFGDYKPGAYVYLAVPSVAIFGLSEFAVRLPSALFGILAIFGVYLLVKEIFKDEKNNHLIGSFAALSLAIMPLHIHFSRGAWETNVFATLLLFSIYFLLKFIRTGKCLNYSILLALFTLITYQSAKLLTPLVILFIIFIYWGDFLKNLKPHLKNKFNLGVIAFSLAFVISMFITTTGGDAGNRLKRLSIFSYKPKNASSIFYNRPQLMTKLIAGRYLNHLSPALLFYEGVTPYERGHFPGMGVLLPFDFIAFLLGFAFLIKYSNKKTATLIIGLLLLSPIPGALTLSEYSTVRTFFMTIPLSLILGVGLYYAYIKIKPLFILISLITFVIFIYLCDLLFVHANFTYAREFQYGYKESIEFINQYKNSKVIMTDANGQPYIFYLFYTKYDPAVYQKNNSFISGDLDVGRVAKIDNIEFHQFSDGEITLQSDTIFVGTVGNIQNEFDYTKPEIEVSKKITYPNGLDLYRIVKTKAIEK